MRSKGFTLIEVLIVVIILGILAAVAVPQLTSAIERSKGSEARQGLGHILREERIYYSAYNEYTDSNIDDEIMTELNSNAKYWAFTISEADDDSFIGQATRSGGTLSGTTITIEQDGTIGGDWPYNIGG
ncbi:MAG: prepilin-type N-terminal cleavage/methylation domain-containing protein [Candidatus Omnitrophota bacterium]